MTIKSLKIRIFIIQNKKSMAQLVFVIGDSGTGKSTSLRNLNDDETVIINSDQKALPFPKFKSRYNEEKGNYIQTNSLNEVRKWLKQSNDNPKIKHVVIDTLSRLGTDFIMSKAFRDEKGFDKWNNVSGAIYDIINIINEKMREDIIVYIFAHADITQDDNGFTSKKILMPGKQLNKFVLESFSSIVLYTSVTNIPGKGNEYKFRTINNNDTCKTPIGLFDSEFIENDLKQVSEKIREYYEI